jgi:hypothetical protein
MAYGYRTSKNPEKDIEDYTGVSVKEQHRREDDTLFKDAEIARRDTLSRNAADARKTDIAKVDSRINDVQGRATQQMEGATVNRSEDQQFRSNQLQQMQRLQDRALGRGGPSVAETQLNQSTDRNLANLMALQSAQRGRGARGFAGAQNVQAQGVNALQSAAGDAATLRAQEQIAAEQQLTDAARAAREQDIGVATTQAGLTQSASQSNMQARIQQQQFKDELTSKYMQMGLNVAEAGRAADLELEKLNTNQSNLVYNTANQRWAKEQLPPTSLMDDIEQGLGIVGKGAGALGSLASAFLNRGGMLVPGKGNKDTEHAMLTPGELVIPKDLTTRVLKAANKKGGIGEKLSKELKEVSKRHGEKIKFNDGGVVENPSNDSKVGNIFAGVGNALKDDENDKKLRSVKNLINSRTPLPSLEESSGLTGFNDRISKFNDGGLIDGFGTPEGRLHELNTNQLFQTAGGSGMGTSVGQGLKKAAAGFVPNPLSQGGVKKSYVGMNCGGLIKGMKKQVKERGSK